MSYVVREASFVSTGTNDVRDRDCRLTEDTARSHLAGVTTWCSLFIAPCASLFFASWTFTLYGSYHA